MWAVFNVFETARTFVTRNGRVALWAEQAHLGLLSIQTVGDVASYGFQVPRHHEVEDVGEQETVAETAEKL